jgi:GT2 family glycosyltransferase/tetratricopeptide (TPR) repeat protein
VLCDAGDRAGARKLARRRRLLHRSAPGSVPAEPWFAEAPPAGEELASVVVLCCNELDATQVCLESVLRHTRGPYELVLVDNGSTDGTADYFRTVPDATVIANADNRGFPAGANQGIGAAKGRQVLLLNNDTVVPPGWLGRLLRTLHRGPQVGLVGPCSNWVSGEQQVAVSYGEDLAGLDAFAAGWALSHAGQDQDTDRLVGFCLLVRREVFDKVGLLDERFGVGCFEDDDLCRRALRAGYRAAIARDAFVHHFGHRTFQGCGADFAAVMRENAELFRAKWAGASPGREAPAAVGPDVAAPAGPGGFTLRAAEGGGLLLGPARPLLSACLIVRDNARTIGACLTSIRPWVDELVVVDTGSTDETPAIAQRLGARVSHFAWCDDFSAARNESLRHARGRWLFWMDSDDTIDAKNGRALRELALRDPDPAVFGYVVRVHCPGPDGAELTAVDHVKLFRNRPDVRFDGRIHEQLLPAIRHAGGEVAWTDLFVTHSGYDHSPEGQKRKLARDFRLLRLELAERPEHPFTLFNLGMTHNDIGEYEEASGWLRRSIAASGPGETHVRKAYALLAHALAGAGRVGEAQAACDEGLRQFPLDDELRFRSGVLLLEAGRAAESASAFEDVLARTEERHFTSVVDGLRGYRARQNLALAYAALGELGKAVAQWRAVTQEAPSYRYGWRGLGEALLAAGRAGEAQDLAGRLRRDPALAPEGHILAARAAEAGGDWPAARSALAGAVRDWPEDREVLREWCRHHFERGTPAEAEPVLERLVALGPDEPAAWHNLGAARLGRGDDAGAAEALRKSLQLRPRSVPTLVQLGHALRGAGRPLEAEQAWGEALRLSPNDREAASALERSRAERRGGGGRGRGR